MTVTGPWRRERTEPAQRLRPRADACNGRRRALRGADSRAASARRSRTNDGRETDRIATEERPAVEAGCRARWRRARQWRPPSAVTSTSRSTRVHVEARAEQVGRTHGYTTRSAGVRGTRTDRPQRRPHRGGRGNDAEPQRIDGEIDQPRRDLGQDGGYVAVDDSGPSRDHGSDAPSAPTPRRAAKALGAVDLPPGATSPRARRRARGDTPQRSTVTSSWPAGPTSSGSGGHVGRRSRPSTSPRPRPGRSYSDATDAGLEWSTRAPTAGPRRADPGPAAHHLPRGTSRTTAR